MAESKSKHTPGLKWIPISLKPNRKQPPPIPAGWYPWNTDTMTADTYTGPLTKAQARAECASRNVAIAKAEGL